MILSVDMKPNLSEIQRILILLADTSGRLAVAVMRVDESRLRTKPEPGAWSVMDNLAHLRACADVWGASIESMLAEEEPSLLDLHPRKWLTQADKLHFTNICRVISNLFHST